MKKYLVVVLSVGGLGNRIYHSGEVHPENAFDAKNLPELISNGSLVEHSEKAVKDQSELEKAQAELADLSAVASEAVNKAAELKLDAEAADKEYTEAGKVAEVASEEDKAEANKLVEEKFALASAAMDKASEAATAAEKALEEVEAAKKNVDKLAKKKK